MGRNDALKQALFRKDWVLGYLLAAYLVTFFAFFVALAAVVACLPDDALTLPTTATAPGPGTTVDSSPVDHWMRRSDPITPVTTPSRGAWPILVDSTRTRSPTVGMGHLSWRGFLMKLESGWLQEARTPGGQEEQDDVRACRASHERQDCRVPSVGHCSGASTRGEKAERRGVVTFGPTKPAEPRRSFNATTWHRSEKGTEMQAKDAIRKVPVTVPPERSLVEVAKLMDEAAVGAVVIVEDDKPVGIVTDRRPHGAGARTEAPRR